jgi:RNA polymerase sigma-70 factor (ECF subfamily)
VKPVEVDAREERFRSMYASTRPRLISYAIRRTRSPEDAADAIAEVFAIAWRRFDVVPEDDRNILWLYATARQVIANSSRRQRNRTQVMERLRHEAAVSLRGPPSSHEDALVAAAVLSQMPEDDREILMLTAWEGLDTRQLACLLGCTNTAARIRLHRARNRLSDAIAAAEIPSKQVPDTRRQRPRAAAQETTKEV